MSPIAPGSLAVFAALTALGGWLVIGAARRLNLLALGEESAQQLGGAPGGCDLFHSGFDFGMG